MNAPSSIETGGCHAPGSLGGRRRRHLGQQGFTILEVSLAAFVMVFSREARMANSVGSACSATSVTLGIPDTSACRTAVAYSATCTFNATEVKQIEVNLVAHRTNVTVATATNKVLSARFILRNT
jgi:hypothetical protein